MQAIGCLPGARAHGTCARGALPESPCARHDAALGAPDVRERDRYPSPNTALAFPDRILLILDEATEGPAPLVRAEIWSVLEMLKREGLTLVVIDKNIAALKRLADRHYVVEKGRIVWDEDSAALTASPEVLHQYVGV